MEEIPKLTERHPFGKTGLEVSPLGFGGAPIGFLETDRERVAGVLNLLLDHGVNLIDTAAMYRGSEALIGETIGDRRDDFVLVSKCGHKIDGVDHEAWTPELITASINRSLEQLRTDTVDVMLLHSCDIDTLKKGEALEALLKAKRAGKIRFAGYSGDNEAAAYAAGLEGVSVIQTSINICDQRNIDAVLPETRDHDLGVMVKRPIANAAWKKLDDQPGMYKNYASEYTKRFAEMGLNPKKLGFEGPKDWPEIALRFTLSTPGVHTAIIGTTNPDNALANIRAAAKGQLPAEAYAAIRGAFSKADPEGKWTGQT
ncbi:MAG: aldo/keto reductase [Rhodobacteraceae bacterium]|nr:aldo/keto reductase [Phycisphaerales bacterium]MCC5964011.1 aldo/keto reductase [Paracoccaceae bacterium]